VPTKAIKKPFPDPWPLAGPDDLTCSQCKWLDSEDEHGLNCQQTRGVTEGSLFCLEFDKKRLLSGKTLEDVKNDPELVGLLERLDNPKWKLDSSIITEIERMFIFTKPGQDAFVRPSAEIPITFHSENDLVPLAQQYDQAQAYRDRAIAIMLSVKVLSKSLNKFWRIGEVTAKKYPVIQNLDSLTYKVTLDDLLKPLRDQLDAVEHLVDACETIIGNLTNSHFALREIKEIGITYLSRLHKL
jgi:hypothetical protein